MLRPVSLMKYLTNFGLVFSAESAVNEIFLSMENLDSVCIGSPGFSRRILVPLIVCIGACFVFTI